MNSIIQNLKLVDLYSSLMVTGAAGSGIYKGSRFDQFDPVLGQVVLRTKFSGVLSALDNALLLVVKQRYYFMMMRAGAKIMPHVMLDSC